MLAMKGERAQSEVEEHGRLMKSMGAVNVKVMECGVNYLTPPVTVVVAVKASQPTAGRKTSGSVRKSAGARDQRTPRPNGSTRRSK